MQGKREKLSIETVEKVVNGIKNGKSLRVLSKELKLGIGTIYHYRKQYIQPKVRKFYPNNLSEREIGELMGAFAGDGSYYNSKHGRSSHHIIRFSLNKKKDLDYAKYLIRLLKKIYLTPFLIESKNRNMVEVKINSIKMIEFIKTYLTWDGKKTYTVQLKREAHSYSDQFLKGFFIGLLRTDGFRNSKKYFIGCTSRNLIKNVSDVLNNNGIENVTRERLDKRPNRKPIYLVSAPCDVIDKKIFNGVTQI